MKKQKLTIKDVAEYANVSPATVSRVLNDYKWINTEVKERVQKAIEELHYVPDFTAKAMVKGKSQVAVVIVPIIDNHFFTQLINTIIQEMKKHGYYVVVYTTESADEERSFLKSSICQMADGILDATSLKELTPLYRLGKPIVLIDRYFEDNAAIDCVMNQNYEALYRGTKYLIQKGHKRIAFLVGAEGHGIAEERIRGYRDCLKDHGIPMRPDYFIQDCWKVEAGVRHASQLLSMQEPPTAVISGNNTLTSGVLEEVRTRGLTPGNDISLIGFEECDDDVQAFKRYGISSFHLDTSAIAVRAVELLLKRMEQPEMSAPACMESLELKFIERTSVQELSV
ncbi:LacI family DNA-binding transcriptional regulator [Hungatella effluvii]|uniref:LacI family DNA-binding transcriptional regulator n=1 Tax=Hungatella effluvii TaxID=1096246 RepID=UPI0022E32D5A|nr:LacI family DNA-binding transcriptional regulator [Hungatella effluvii]